MKPLKTLIEVFAAEEKRKNPHAVVLGRKGGLARRGKPGRKLTSEEAKRIRAIRTEKQKTNEDKP